MGGDVVWLGR